MSTLRELVESLNKPAPQLPDVEDIGNSEELWTQKEDKIEEYEKTNDQILRNRRFRSTILDEDDAGEAVNADDVFTGEGISGISQKANFGSRLISETTDESENTNEDYSKFNDEAMDPELYGVDSDEEITEAQDREFNEQGINDGEDAESKIKLNEVMKKSNFEQQVKKGKYVKRQMDIFEKLIHLQMKTHSALRVYNRLPRGTYAKKLLKLAGEDTIKQYKEAKNDIFKFLETLLVIEDKLLSSSKQTESVIGMAKGSGKETSDEEIESSDDEYDDEEDGDDEPDTESSNDKGSGLKNEMNNDEDENLKELEHTSVVHGKHRNIGYLNKELKRREDRFIDLRKQILCKWDERTQLAGVEKNSERSADSAILKQIEEVMSYKHRLIRRTQIKRSDGERIGGNSETVCDSEIFDDDDFYQQILRDLIEKKTTNTSDPIEMSRQWIQIQQLRQKRSKKKVVDTKASKGRKIRYVVIPKLVNYFPSTPETVKWSHEMRNQLFQSLFTSSVF